ncbi:hypothetical protein BDA96_03G413500 [Sorghum bicolor]|uniref:Uncharacterized protein n=1 Tax=Sorghum bicolor TaxID=4558 RepID=A0A921RHQ6_SORBI|nr:hypothetical protein BDA96_03G413500 [Sorghum bicolor]
MRHVVSSLGKFDKHPPLSNTNSNSIIVWFINSKVSGLNDSMTTNSLQGRLHNTK